MEGRNGNTVLLTVIGVATLLVALVGATFAYFSATVSNESAQSVSIQTAKGVQLEYVGGTAVLPNAMPGAESLTNPFTVTYPAGEGYTTTYYYDLVLVIDANGFTNEPLVEQGQTKADEQLFLTITGDTITEQVLNLTAGVTDEQTIATGIAITPSTADAANVQNYNLKVQFVDTNENQNENQDKSFAAHIEVRNVNSTAPTSRTNLTSANAAL